MASVDHLDRSVFFHCLGFLKDKEVLLLVTASKKLQDCVVAARCTTAKLELLPGVGLHGLWNHLELWEVPLCLVQCANLRITSRMCLRNIQYLRTFMAAVQRAREPFKGASALRVLVNSFTFPGCDFCVGGDLHVQSSQVIVGTIPLAY